jgi:hypothetical protein
MISAQPVFVARTLVSAASRLVSTPFYGPVFNAPGIETNPDAAS